MRKKELEKLLTEQKILSSIYVIRGEKVMLDRDLAVLFGIETRVLKQAVGFPNLKIVICEAIQNPVRMIAVRSLATHVARRSGQTAMRTARPLASAHTSAQRADRYFHWRRIPIRGRAVTFRKLKKTVAREGVLIAVRSLASAQTSTQRADRYFHWRGIPIRCRAVTFKKLIKTVAKEGVFA